MSVHEKTCDIRLHSNDSAGCSEGGAGREAILPHEHLVEADDIGVVQLLQRGDLVDRAHTHTLFVLGGQRQSALDDRSNRVGMTLIRKFAEGTSGGNVACCIAPCNLPCPSESS